MSIVPQKFNPIISINLFFSTFMGRASLLSSPIRKLNRKSLFNLEKQEEFPFLNYWNLDQSFLIEGLASREGIDNLVSLLRLKNRYIEFCENATIDECAQEVSQALTQRSNTFRAIMNNQRFMQLRYSVIALLSQGHVCLFN